jgi:hypothetical protein
VISFTPRPLYSQGKSPWYPVDRRLGRPQSHGLVFYFKLLLERLRKIMITHTHDSRQHSEPYNYTDPPDLEI